MRERANRGPQICGRKVSRRPGKCGIPRIPYVRFMLQRFHFCEPPHSVSCVGCKGSHGDQGVAHEPKLSPPTSLFFCTSAFCEKENPEETTFPYRRTLSINGTWGRRGTARTRAVSIPSVLGSRRLCRRHPQVPHAEEGGRAGNARAAQHGSMVGPRREGTWRTAAPRAAHGATWKLYGRKRSSGATRQHGGATARGHVADGGASGGARRDMEALW